MGRFRFGELSKRVIHGHFRGFAGTKAERCSELYFQKCWKASFSSHALAGASLLASTVLSFLRTCPRTRLPFHLKDQRIFFS